MGSTVGHRLLNTVHSILCGIDAICALGSLIRLILIVGGKMVASQPVRLYVKGTFTGFKRGRRNTYHHTTLLKIDGANDAESSRFYLGKKVAYIYKAPTLKAGSKFRVVWGKVLRTHGSNGLVRAKFAKNLPSKAIGAGIRVMLYPSSV